jgi:hypothetical protein
VFICKNKIYPNTVNIIYNIIIIIIIFVYNEHNITYFQDIFSKEENLFNLKQGDIQPQLLILDRREDPVTPLLIPVRLI